MAGIEVAEVEAGPLGNRLDRDGRFSDAIRHLDSERVEIRVILLAVAELLRRFFYRHRGRMYSPGD